MQVRRIRPDEWEALRAFRLRALAEDPEAFGETLDEARALPDDAWQARAVEGAAGEARLLLVAEDAPRRWLGMVGARGEPDAPEVEMLALWVAPEARGRGVGRALVDGVRAWARWRGAARVTLWVNAANAPARALYARCGFAPSGAARPGTRHPARRYLPMVRDS